MSKFAALEVAREIPSLLGELFVAGSASDDGEKRLAAGWRVRF